MTKKKDAEQVRRVAEELAASRGFLAAPPDPEAMAKRNDAALRERMEQSGFYPIDSAEEETSLREAAERAGAEIRMSSAPQRHP